MVGTNGQRAGTRLDQHAENESRRRRRASSPTQLSNFELGSVRPVSYFLIFLYTSEREEENATSFTSIAMLRHLRRHNHGPSTVNNTPFPTHRMHISTFIQPFLLYKLIRYHPWRLFYSYFVYYHSTSIKSIEYNTFAGIGFMPCVLLKKKKHSSVSSNP